jgi:hypothetical protein
MPYCPSSSIVKLTSRIVCVGCGIKAFDFLRTSIPLMSISFASQSSGPCPASPTSELDIPTSTFAPVLVQGTAIYFGFPWSAQGGYRVPAEQRLWS